MSQQSNSRAEKRACAFVEMRALRLECKWKGNIKLTLTHLYVKAWSLTLPGSSLTVRIITSDARLQSLQGAL